MLDRTITVDKHTAFREDLAAYALGALDASEIPALEAHLRNCKSCAADLAAYAKLTDGLLAAVPPRTPPGTLKRRLQQHVRSEGRQSRSGFQWSFGRLALGVGVGVLILLNIVSLFQVNSMRRDLAEQDARSTAAQTAIAMLAYPGTQMLPFNENGVAGSLLVDKQRNLLAIFAWHLPPPSAGKVYQVWLIDPQGNRVSGGFLIPDSGYPFAMTVVQPTGPLTGFTSLGVTLEPFGGSPGPTGPKILGVSF